MVPVCHRSNVLILICTIAVGHTYKHILEGPHEILSNAFCLKVDRRDLDMRSIKQLVHFREILVSELGTSI